MQCSAYWVTFCLSRVNILPPSLLFPAKLFGQAISVSKCNCLLLNRMQPTVRSDSRKRSCINVLWNSYDDEADQLHCKVGLLPVQLLCYLLLQLEVVLTNVIRGDPWSMLASAIIRVDGSENKADTPKFIKMSPYRHRALWFRDVGFGAGIVTKNVWTIRRNECETVTRAAKSKWSVIFFLLGDSPASEFYVPTFRNALFHIHRSFSEDLWRWNRQSVPKHSFIHSVFCLMTGPKPPPKRFLHIVRSRASSFKWEYPLPSLRSCSSFLRLLPRLHVTSISPFIFPSITCFRRQFLRKMWQIQLAFHFLNSCRLFLCSLTLSNTSSFLSWSVQLIFTVILSRYFCFMVSNMFRPLMWPSRGWFLWEKECSYN